MKRLDQETAYKIDSKAEWQLPKDLTEIPANQLAELMVKADNTVRVIQKECASRVTHLLGEKGFHPKFVEFTSPDNLPIPQDDEFGNVEIHPDGIDLDQLKEAFPDFEFELNDNRTQIHMTLIRWGDLEPSK